jgi:O-antigen/teichoic acid export membrane protein
VFNSVLFPLLSRIHRDGGALFSSVFMSARRPWLIVAGWASACLVSGGPALISFLYDKRATSGGWMIQILACSTWLLALETANSTALLALGRPRWVALGSAAKLAGMVVLIPIGIHLAGFPGALIGFAGSEALRYVTSVVGAKTLKISGLWQDGTLSLLVAASAGAGWVTQLTIQRLLVRSPIHQMRLLTLIQLLGIGATVGMAWGGYYLMTRVWVRTVPAT